MRKLNKKVTESQQTKGKKFSDQESISSYLFSSNRNKTSCLSHRLSPVLVPSPDAASLPKPSLCLQREKQSKLNKGEQSDICELKSTESSSDLPGLDYHVAGICEALVTTPPTKPKGKVQVGLSEKDQNACKRKKKSSKKENETKNHKLTEYFPVRRSNRKTVYNRLKERQQIIEEAILSGNEDGFEVRAFPNKGRGVVATKNLQRGDFVLEYYGELIDTDEAKVREEYYALKANTGCYMYYFKHQEKQYCVDATKESGRLGRLVNHSKKGNLKTMTFSGDDGLPHLILIAARDIPAGQELLYDYGDRSKMSLEFYPWLAL